MEEDIWRALNGTHCKSCAKKIVFISVDGKVIPVDAVAPVYRLVDDVSNLGWKRDRWAFVSHFATCPQASTHSKKTKEDL